MNTPAAQAKNGHRYDVPQSLVIMNATLLLIVYMIPAPSLRETRCQSLYERSGAGRQGRSKTRNSNSGHRVVDSLTYSDARPS